MEIEEAFTTYLLAQSELTALIGTRLEPEEIPQFDALPAVVYIKISDVKNHTLAGQSELESPVFQFTVFASSRAGARAVTNQLKTAFVDYSGTLSGIVIQKIELQSESTGLEKSSDGTVKVYTEDLEFQIFLEKE
jgi:hypothetical protein